MYFSKNEFTPNVDVKEKAERDAQQAIRIGAENFGITLDGTIDSLRGVDEILDQIHGSIAATGFPKEAFQRFVEIFGAYFGEVLRQAHGATWGVLRIFSDQVAALCVGPSDIVLIPRNLASERIMKGTGKDLRTYYETLVRSLQADEERAADSGRSAEGGTTSASSGKLYTLRHDQGYFDAGNSADGRQLLMDFFWTGLTVIIFDSEGNLLECETRPLPTEAPENTPAFEAAVERSLKAWKDEIGFQPKPIRVRQFSAPEQGVGIEDRPDHYEEFLKAPELEEPDEEERQAMFEQIREWDEEGSFVLYWGNDLWLNADGEVTSS